VGAPGPHLRALCPTAGREHGWQRGRRLPRQLLGVPANHTGQNPTSRQPKSGKLAPVLLKMKKTTIGKRDRWLEESVRDRLEGIEIHKKTVKYLKK